MLNEYRNYENSALSALIRNCQEDCSPPVHAPEYLEFGAMIKLDKRHRHSPAYTAWRHDNGHCGFTFMTFQGGWNQIKWSSYDNQVRTIDESAPATRGTKLSNKVKEQIEGDVRKLNFRIKHIIGYIEAGANTWCDHPYLQKKQVLDQASNIHGVRINKGNLYIPTYTLDGMAKSMQNINQVGEKRYVESIANTCAIIGSGDIDNKKNYHVCEGVATGLSIHAALVELVEDPIVLAAMDLGNMRKVVAGLRGLYPNATIRIYADNDQFDKDTGKVRSFNPGLSNAHKMALEYNCDVVAPMGMTSGSDFNDMHIKHGLDEVLAQIQCVEHADPAIAYADEISKVKATGSRYLESLDIKPGINCVRSPVGTGKTTALKPFIAQGGSAIYISHLKALTTTASNVIGMDLYLGQTAEEIRNSERLAICLNSLPKLTKYGAIKTYDTVVIDEVEQLARRLVGSGKDGVKNKHVVLEVLAYLIKSAKHVVILDAHLTNVGINFIRNMAPNSQVHDIINDYRIGAGRRVVSYAGHGDVLDRGLQELEAGGNVFLCTNSKIDALAYGELIKNKYPNKLGLVVCSETAGEGEVRAFFEDPTGTVKKYDYLVCSPSASTGVSINTDESGKPAFSFVGGIFKNNITLPTDVVQSMGRVRGSKEMHLYAEGRLGRVPRTPLEINARQLYAEEEMYDLGLEHHIVDGRLQVVEDLYTKLTFDIISHREHSQRHFADNVLKQLAIEGYHFTFVKTVTNNAISKEARSLEKEVYTKRIKDTLDITTAEAENLNNKSHRTILENASLEKYDLNEFYKPGDTAEQFDEVISMDRRGGLRREVAKLEVGIMAKSDIMKVQDVGMLTADRRPYTLRKNYIRALLSFTKRGYDKQAALGFIELLIKHREQLSAVVKIPAAEYLRKNPLQFIGIQLRSIGISTVRDKSKASTKDNPRYTFDKAKTDALIEILIRRQPEKEADIRAMLL